MVIGQTTGCTIEVNQFDVKFEFLVEIEIEIRDVSNQLEHGSRGEVK